MTHNKDRVLDTTPDITHPNVPLPRPTHTFSITFGCPDLSSFLFLLFHVHQIPRLQVLFSWWNPKTDFTKSTLSFQLQKECYTVVIQNPRQSHKILSLEHIMSFILQDSSQLINSIFHWQLSTWVCTPRSNSGAIQGSETGAGRQEVKCCPQFVSQPAMQVKIHAQVHSPMHTDF
jgi:hypothetical protein